jgi:hypothetical protein
MVRGYSPIRPRKVLELKAKLNEYEGLTVNEQYVLMFEDIRDPSDGVSNREISLARRPKQTEKDKYGNDVPTLASMEDTRGELSAFRVCKSNKGMTPICFKDAITGMFLWYWVQKVKDYEPMITFKKTVHDGLDYHTKTDLDNIKKPTKTKQKFVDGVKFDVNNKKRRKKKS